MSTEQELLEIERERLRMERKRDRHTNIRFVVGTILLAAATTGASIYISERQAKRMLINDQKQLVIPMLMRVEANDFDKEIEIIDDFIENADFDEEVVTSLKNRRTRTLREKKEYEEKLASEQAAKEELERLSKIAEEEERKAKAITAFNARKEAEAKARIAREKEIAAAKAAENAKREIEARLRELQYDRMRQIGAF